jgi:hypothetical protein
MLTVRPQIDLTAARSEALFTSSAPTGSELTREQATALIRYEVRRHHGVRGCAVELAAEYGDHPEVAVPRMQWAIATVTALYPRVGQA